MWLFLHIYSQLVSHFVSTERSLIGLVCVLHGNGQWPIAIMHTEVYMLDWQIILLQSV